MNATPHRRVEWGLATVPFPEGAWLPGQNFGAAGYPSCLTPFGAPWPDGSVRYAQLEVALDLAPGEERLVTIQGGPPVSSTFKLSPWVTRGLPVFRLALAVGVPGQAESRVELQPTAVVHQTPARKVALYRGRMPRTDLVYDLWLSTFSDSDHMPFELRVTSSRTGSTKWDQDFDYVDLWVTGAIPHIRGALRRGVGLFPPTMQLPNHVRLLGADHFHDGQGQEWWGELHFYHPYPSIGAEEPRRLSTLGAVITQPLYGVSTDWQGSGAFGPFGYVPPPPPWVVDGGRAATQAERQAFEAWRLQPGGPWDDLPLGLYPDPATTGAQDDFGAARLLQIFASGIPLGIEEARQNASEEALRPVHHREDDGEPVLSRNHPDWVTWEGRTHFNNAVSPDRLGKPFPGVTLNAHGWKGRDHQHWSSLVLASTYLLTGSHSLRYELDNEAELYISSHTLPSQKPNWSTNGHGASRGVGRTYLSMSWNYLCTANGALRDRMVKRAEESVFPGGMLTQVTGPVRPLNTNGPEPRLLMRDHWRPWEEAQAVLGLEACYRVTGSFWAHVTAVATARTLMLYGWHTTANETIVATALGWKSNGVPLTALEYESPAWVLWSTGTGFNEWSLSAVKLAIRYGWVYGDTELMLRSLYVYNELVEARVKPSYTNGWDRFSEWDAVW